MLCRNCHRETDEFATECVHCGADIKPDYNTLITEVLNNNIKANEVLYNATYKQVYFIASKLSNVMQSPDDIVSKCYETALDNLHVLSNRNNFQRWINSIAATIIVSGIRKQRPDFLREQGGPAILPEHPAGDYKPVMNRLASNPNISQAAANFIYKLTDEEKLFYLMYYYNGMSAAEISKIFKISPSAVTTHISSLNQKIRDELIVSPTADSSPLACTAFAKLGLAHQFEEAFPKKRPVKIPQENIPLADDVRRISANHDRTQVMGAYNDGFGVPQQQTQPRYPSQPPQNQGYGQPRMQAQNGRYAQGYDDYDYEEQPVQRRRPPRQQPEKSSSQDTGSKLRMALILSACSVIIIAAIIITLVLFKKENYDNQPVDPSIFDSYEEIEPIMPTTEPPTEAPTESPDRERPEFDYDRQSEDAEYLMEYAEDFMFADSDEEIGCYYILDIDFDGGMELVIREDTGDDTYRHEIFDITSDGDVNLSKTLKSSGKSYYEIREIVREDGEGKDYEFIKVGKTGTVYSYSLETEDTTELEEYDEGDFFCGADEHEPRTIFILYSDGSDEDVEIEVPTEPETEEETEPEEEETEAEDDDDEDSEDDNSNSSGSTGTVKVDDSLKLRSSPSTADSSNVVAKMPNKSKVTITSDGKITENGVTWYKVKYTDKDGNTFEGYASSDYITID